MTVLESNFLVPNATFVFTAVVALLLVVALIVMVVTVLVRRRTAIAPDTTTRAEQKPPGEDGPRRVADPARAARGSAFEGRVPLLRIANRSSGAADARSETFDRRVPLLQFVDRATGEPRPRQRPVPSRTGSLAARWTAALARYDTVMTEWGAIASDPLSALEHSALLDVTQPRTAAFVEALGRAQDRRAVLGSDMPRDRADVVEFEDLARRVAVAWADARRHAAHVGYGWMPDNDRALAERADTLLRLAADTSASLHERVAAAEQATKVLRSIHAIVLPEPALEVIASQRRLALEAWQSSRPPADGPDPVRRPRE
jgi:hypothetical protein